MNNTTKYPLTLREFGQMAAKRGMTAPRLLEVLGPIPMPPEGYTLAPKSDTRWIGTETMNRRWIITPVWNWNSTGGTHSIEVWMANHEPPACADITPVEALQLAADLTAVANALPGGKN